MDPFATPAGTALLIGLQLLGLTSAWLARLDISSTVRLGCRVLFFGCLAAVGSATVVLVASGDGGWCLAGSTVSLMALGATAELPSQGHAWD